MLFTPEVPVAPTRSAGADSVVCGAMITAQCRKAFRVSGKQPRHRAPAFEPAFRRDRPYPTPCSVREPRPALRNCLPLRGPAEPGYLNSSYVRAHPYVSRLRPDVARLRPAVTAQTDAGDQHSSTRAPFRPVFQRGALLNHNAAC